MRFTSVLKELATSPDPVLKARAQGAITRLMHAMGQMMLVDGLFHADPHPGNLLLCEDGTSVLLDFGQCKVLEAGLQLDLCSFYRVS